VDNFYNSVFDVPVNTIYMPELVFYSYGKGIIIMSYNDTDE